MRVALVLAPEWTVETPPLSLASLAAWLEQEGHETRCIDLNVHAFHSLPAERAAELWDLRSQHLWLDERAKQTRDELWPVLAGGLDAALADFEPHLVGFSLYATNIQTSCALAAHVKKHHPNAPVVFGGPP